jgi:maleate isomerase
VTDVLGWRAVLGVLGPSTNTVVQPEMEAMRPAGVTNHYRAIFTPDAQALSDASFVGGTQRIAAGVQDAIRSASTCNPDYLVCGISAITFVGGRSGADAFERQACDVAGVGVSIGSHSCAAALKALGDIRRISFLSPYFPPANADARRYFTEAGFEVVQDVCLRCPSWTAIGKVSRQQLISTLQELDRVDVDAIVQIGTNLSMASLAAEAELWLRKPVVAINTATYWHALRTLGIHDKIQGFGALLASL